MQLLFKANADIYSSVDCEMLYDTWKTAELEMGMETSFGMKHLEPTTSTFQG